VPTDVLPTVTIVICTRNRPGDVETCLPTILDCDYPNYDVVIVDQSTDDETGKVIASLQKACPAVHYLHTTTVGKTRALNLALPLAKGEILAFTDDDCEVPTDWLRNLVAAFAEKPEIEVVFGPVYPSPALDGLENICVPSWVFDEARPISRTETCGMGANMAFRRSLLDAMPAGDIYDPNLGPGTPFPAGEEGDMIYRLRRHITGETVLRPAAKLYHRAYRTPENWQKILFGYGVGDAAFLTKHIRCGDLRAFGIASLRFANVLARGVAKALLRREHQLVYVRGYWAGLWKSLRFPIDRRTRLYKDGAAAG